MDNVIYNGKFKYQVLLSLSTTFPHKFLSTPSSFCFLLGFPFLGGGGAGWGWGGGSHLKWTDEKFIGWSTFTVHSMRKWPYELQLLSPSLWFLYCNIFHHHHHVHNLDHHEHAVRAIYDRAWYIGGWVFVPHLLGTDPLFYHHHHRYSPPPPHSPCRHHHHDHYDDNHILSVQESFLFTSDFSCLYCLPAELQQSWRSFKRNNSP